MVSADFPMKAMILAAGRGERMRPLTDTTPKPLLPVGNTTLIEHVLHEVKKAGVTEVIINVHYLGNQIMQHCGDGSRYGLTIHYSIEETLLDTGGGIFNALPLLGHAPFLLLSADIWTDFPLSELVNKSVNAAHLVLVNNPPFHSQGDFGLNAANKIEKNSATKLTYANIGVIHPDLFKDETAGVFPLRKVLFPAIEEGLVTGEHYRGQWYNVGTVEELKKLGDQSMASI
jgi:MurNAc alpha-1-phosphate uridylyltransferase